MPSALPFGIPSLAAAGLQQHRAPAQHPILSLVFDGRDRRQTLFLIERSSKRRKGYPSESHVKCGLHIVRGNKVLCEKLGRNDLCPCGSGRSFQEMLFENGPPSTSRTATTSSVKVAPHRPPSIGCRPS